MSCIWEFQSTVSAITETFTHNYTCAYERDASEGGRETVYFKSELTPTLKTKRQNSPVRIK